MVRFRCRGGRVGAGGLDAQRAQGVEDDGHVDRFLDQGALHGGQVAQGGGDHAQNRQADARDELGISETVMSHPVQAAVVSALTFAAGAVVPLVVAVLAPPAQIVVFVVVATLLALAVLGGLGASAGGAGIFRGAMRVMLWGVLAMGATAVVGTLFGVTVG